MQVDVTVMGDPEGGYYMGLPDEEWWNKPLSQRPHVALQVDEDWRFVDILREAGRRSGVPTRYDRDGNEHLPSYVSFVDPADTSGETMVGMSLTVVLVDDVGGAVFDVGVGEALYGDLLRSAAAGALEGDPRRPVLVLFSGWGDGPGLDWAEALAALQLAGPVLQHLATADGVLGALERIKDLVQRIAHRLHLRHEVEQLRWRDWEQAGATYPISVNQLVGDRTWGAQRLAALLRCRVGEAEAFLAGRGYRYDSLTQLWRAPRSVWGKQVTAPRQTSREDELLVTIVDAAEYATFATQGTDARKQAVDEAITKVLRHFATTGEVRPLLDLNNSDAPTGE